MENPSLRVSGHVCSMNRAYIVEDFAEDGFGQWAEDEVTGEQGYDDDERSCFWTWDNTDCACLAVQTVQGPSRVKKKRQRTTDNTKENPKEAEEVSLHKNKHQILKCGQKRTLLGETKDAKARKACQKAMMAFTRVVFSPLPAR